MLRISPVHHSHRLSKIKTIIAGSRTIRDPQHLRNALASCPWTITELTEGGALGVDRLARDWAFEQNIYTRTVLADWDKFSKAAGNIRNTAMLHGNTHLIAVWDGWSRGTTDMIAQATAAYGAKNVHIHIVDVPMNLPATVPAIHPSQRRAGEQIAAGTGYATVLADMDFETYGDAGYRWDPHLQRWKSLEGIAEQSRGLGVVGTRCYVEHPSFDLLSLAYDLKDGQGERLWYPSLPYPRDLFAHVAAGGLIEAWNSGFEWNVWNYHCVPKLGWPPLQLTQLRCAMAKARAHALPGKLATAGDVLKLQVKKDKDGDRLLKKFSMPRQPTAKDKRLRLLPLEDPEDGPKLYAYNVVDIKSEAEASSRCPDLSPFELEVWKVDQAINDRGVQIDTAAVGHCIAIVEQAHAKYNAELYHLTDGRVAEASKVAQITVWLGQQGCRMEGLADTLVQAELKKGWAPHIHRALQIREMLGSASVKKVFAMRAQVSSLGRLHDLFSYYKAHTGRWTGNGPQPQNLPKSGPWLLQCESCETFYSPRHKGCPSCGTSHMFAHMREWGPQAVEQALAAIASESLEYVEFLYGDALAIVSGCLRGLFIAAPGKELICSDYSAIEGVVAAALAGEEWRLEVFRTHGKIYEKSAADISGIPFEEILEYKKRTGSHHPHRNKIGKVAELSGGFGGWLDAWARFGARDFFTDDNSLKKAILAWRAASPNIVEMWGGQWRGRPWDANGYRELFGLEGAAIAAILEPGKAFAYRSIVYQVHEDTLYCQLPSGRLIAYHAPRLSASQRQFASPGELSISYEGYNSNAQSGPIGWVRMWTYGGSLFENVVQAVARDIMAHALVELERRGYKVVLHVHDEIVVEVLIGEGSVEEVEAIMSTMPAWAAGWPVKAKGGWRGFRYRKD